MFKEMWKNRYEISEKRLAICDKCDQFDKEKKVCNKCGCYMEYKTLLPYVHCPLYKWDKELDEPKQENTQQNQ